MCSATLKLARGDRLGGRGHWGRLPTSRCLVGVATMIYAHCSLCIITTFSQIIRVKRYIMLSDIIKDSILVVKYYSNYA